MTKKLYRSNNDKVFGGVCGGIAEYFEIDAVIIRIIFVLSVFFLFQGWGVLVYIIMLIIIPKRNLLEDIAAQNENPEPKPDAAYSARSQGKMWFGIALIFFGLIFLAENLIPIFSFIDFWPLLFIFIGLALLWGYFKKNESEQN